MYCCNKIFVKTQTTGDTSRVISPKSRTEHVTCVCSACEERQLVFRKFNPPRQRAVNIIKKNIISVLSFHVTCIRLFVSAESS